MDRPRRVRLATELDERAAEILAGRLEPAEPRDAATVVLLADGAAGPRAYLLRRAATMPFAAGFHVFPGGRVDPRDAESAPRWAGPPPRWWAEALGADPALARALVCAAVRETFEETGVLLAGPDTRSVVADTRGDDWEADRRALEDHSQSLAAFLDRRGLVLRSDLLAPWARWITPAVEPRRYDTRFFAAALPQGQRTRLVGGEADHGEWLDADAAVAAWREGRLPMLPPTVTTLRQVARSRTVADVLARPRTVVPIEPKIVLIDGEPHIVPHGEVEYPA
ncbi:NUDIX hydrolase [Allonocardiopsis opalescens]|uniref:Nudix hydrolase domain-containing protein n=1 Tax=Allonocardiopsis opalescens TaxID=1144618 RepID=A0A2T0Q6N5_9ACTN|nr:NUDIX hydrolase [Allonocardiopsis opalescens]PRX99490.1 hypothetical protein CLV72_10387 [Allonocardiopsis opalescens]